MSKKNTKNQLPKDWKNRFVDKNHWLEVKCDDCKRFIHWIYSIEGKGIQGYYDEIGHKLNDNVREFNTDTFADYLDLDEMPQDYEILCEECFEHWKLTDEGGNLVDKRHHQDLEDE